MKALVVDASVFGPYVLKDEWTERAAALLAEFGEYGLHVPAHWGLEIANMLTSAMRRGRITADDRLFALAGLERFVPVIDDLTSATAWTSTLDLADKHGLTLYDAAYLELAIRLRTMLASNDRALLAAAEKEDVEVRTSLS